MRGLADIAYQSRVWAASNVWHGFSPRQIRPTWAVLRLTENCQARCITCDYWKKTWEEHISTERAVKTLSRLAAIGVRHVHFSGGEPLLRRDLFDILQRAETKRFRVISILTNGLLLKKLSRQINDSSINSVTISIDGLGGVNDSIRGVEGYFDLALEGADLLQGKQIALCASLTGPGADQLEGLIEVAKRRKWSFTFNLLDNRMYFLAGSDLETVWPDPADVETITRVLKSRLNRPDYELDYVRRYYLRGRPNEGPQEPPCVRGFNIISIASNGDVLSGCYGLPPLGNIFNEDIAQIVRSGAYRARCLAMLRRECAGCTCGVVGNLKVAQHIQWLFRTVTGFFHPSSITKGRPEKPKAIRNTKALE